MNEQTKEIEGINCDGLNLNDLSLEFECLAYTANKMVLFFPDTLKICLVKKEFADMLCEIRSCIFNDTSKKRNVEELKKEQYTNETESLCQLQCKMQQIKKIFLHVSHDCNLDCGYCYAEGGGYGRDNRIMSIDTAESAIDYVISNNNIEELTIEFFGGEPMLNYKVINSLIEKIEQKYPHIVFTYGCVTNGTIINKEIQNMFRKYDFHVMLTIDGIKECHDKQRVYKDGGGTYDTIVSHLPRFKESVNKLSARIVYTKKNVALFQMYMHIYEKLGIYDISFRPVMTKNDEYMIEDKEQSYIGSEVCKIFDYYLQKKMQGENLQNKLFDDVLINLFQKKKKLSFCDFGEFVSITPEGDIYPCTHFVYNELYYLGNINSQEVNRNIWNDCIKSRKPQYAPCKSCSIVGLCAGGCKGSVAFYHENTLLNCDEFCDVRKKLIYHIIIEVVKLYEEKRLEQLMWILTNSCKEEVSPNRWR